MKPLFEYLDYRDFMRDHYAESKEKHSYFSFRYVEMKTGLDASFYVKVINKQKHIAQRAISRLAAFFQFNKREIDYFTSLVHFCKSKQKAQIDYYFGKLRGFKDSPAASLDEKKYRYFGMWYAIVIREMLATFEFQGNAAELAKKIVPSITVSQASDALELLEELGLIARDDNGCFRATEHFLTTDSQLRSAAVREFQKRMIHLAGEAIDRFPTDQRDVSSLTISISKACLEAVREKLAQTRKEIMQLVQEDSMVEEVYQINFQVFPVTVNAGSQAKKKGGRA